MRILSVLTLQDYSCPSHKTAYTNKPAEEPLPESVTCERGLSEDADKFSSEFKKQTTPVGLSMISPYATWGRHVHAQPPS